MEDAPDWTPRMNAKTVFRFRGLVVGVRTEEVSLAASLDDRLGQQPGITTVRR
jgi:hypothetical protein